MLDWRESIRGTEVQDVQVAEEFKEAQINASQRD